MSKHILHLFEGYGVELEYMIVHRNDLSILPITDKVIHRVSGTYASEIELGPLNWSNELVLHVIELKTNGPAPALEPLPELFLSHIRKINHILEADDGQLMPTAMHPWMDPMLETQLWTHEYNRVYEVYNRIFDCRGHGWSNLQSLHINLPFADDDEFGRLHAAIRLILPILPAIAASSPIVMGQFSGMMDTRLEFYRNNQNKVPSLTGNIIPEQVYTRKGYEQQLLSRLYQDISPYDPDCLLRHEWLNSRGAIARFDRYTIEIRVLDIQECPLADLAIMAAIVALIRALIAEKWVKLAVQQMFPTERLAGLFLNTIRNSERTKIDDSEYLRLFGWNDGSVCTAGELWLHLYQSELHQVMDDVWHIPFEIILNKGCLSRRIIHSLNGDFSRENLLVSYRKLIRCLQEGTLFIA
ncbi:MAG TPA: glutamate-cysteine ligase family protein [Anaerolineae bacterium]|nr:glutamate-cysteine ligase family protein [Anaerolineae bacterium]